MIEEIIELNFRVEGNSLLPYDNGYLLFSSMCRIMPDLHAMENTLISRINGDTIKKTKQIEITKNSNFSIRLPKRYCNIFLNNFFEKKLTILKSEILLREVILNNITGKKSLYSDLVLLINKDENNTKTVPNPFDYLNKIFQILKNENINGIPELLKQRKEKLNNNYYRMRTCRIHKHNLVGYSLKINNLNENDSILLQKKGLGSGKKCGCGFFK